MAIRDAIRNKCFTISHETVRQVLARQDERGSCGGLAGRVAPISLGHRASSASPASHRDGGGTASGIPRSAPKRMLKYGQAAAQSNGVRHGLCSLAGRSFRRAAPPSPSGISCAAAPPQATVTQHLVGAARRHDSGLIADFKIAGGIMKTIVERIREWLIDIGVAYLEFVLSRDKKFVVTIDPVEKGPSVEELFK